MQLRPMHAAEFDRYQTLTRADYKADLRVNLRYPEALCEQECARQSPASLASVIAEPGHALLVLEDTAGCIGYVWLHCEGVSGHLLDFIIEPAMRGQGHGRRALALIQARLRDQGLFDLQLRVAADNPRAQALYAAAGLQVTGYLMSTPLQPSPAPQPMADHCGN